MHLRNESVIIESKLLKIKDELIEKIKMLSHFKNEIVIYKNKAEGNNILNFTSPIYDDSKIKSKHLKRELIQKKSELPYLNIEIDNLCHNKRNLLNEIEIKRKYFEVILTIRFILIQLNIKVSLI